MLPLEAVQQALEGLKPPPSWYYGHVDCWLSNWNLNEAEAAALIGTEIHGMTCRAVQWANPTYNAATLVPGSLLTLADAQVDLSVMDASWLAAPKPPAAPGWQAQALTMASDLTALLKAHQ